MVQVVLTAVFAVLMLNLVAAAAAAVRQSSSWLLVILLTGTTGAAAVSVLAVMAGDSGRFVDAALVLTATASVTAAVRAALIRAALVRGRGGASAADVGEPA